LIDVQGLSIKMFPSIGDTTQNHGLASVDVFGAPAIIGAIVADQQSAMATRDCNKVGLGKVTYGTSGTLDINTGNELKLATGAYPLVLKNKGSKVDFLLEGMVITAGAMFDWLAHGLELIESAEASEMVAASFKNSAGVFFSSFTGARVSLRKSKTTCCDWRVDQKLDKSSCCKSSVRKCRGTC
jgi:glycerol kinase